MVRKIGCRNPALEKQGGENSGGKTQVEGSEPFDPEPLNSPQPPHFREASRICSVAGMPAICSSRSLELSGSL